MKQDNFFRGVYHVHCAKFMLTIFHNDNPVINDTNRYKNVDSTK